VGTSSLIREDFHSLNLTNLSRICETVRSLKDQGVLHPLTPPRTPAHCVLLRSP